MKDYTNYHGINFREKLLHDSKIYFQRMLDTSPESFLIKIGDESHNVIIRNTKYPNQKDILYHNDAIRHGDVIEYNDHNWLVMSMPINSQMHKMSKIRLCNHSFPIVIEGEREIIDWDRLGRPIYGDPVEVIYDIPCVVENKVQPLIDREDAINLPEGRLVVHISYDDLHDIDLNTKIELFENDYLPYNIDVSDVVDGMGVVRLFVQLDK